MDDSYLGESIGKLGFGVMRLPLKDGKFDIETVNKLVDKFMSEGFTYFDTAYAYEGSEESLRESLVKRYPREAYQVATKIQVLGVPSPERQEDYLNESLRRLGLDYVDFYLLHGLGGAILEKAERFDSWSFMRLVKASGKAKHIGFSFHGTPEELEEILSKHPEAEFVQLQLNYIDWDSSDVRSRELYEIARKYNKPIIIMEPAKGGLLAEGESDAAKLIQSANSDMSAASWAFRFVGGLEGLITVLSGMGTIAQIEDNAKTFKDFTPLSAQEHEVLATAVEMMNSVPTIPCTSCRYCVPNCPKNISIPQVIGIYNKYLTHKAKSSAGYEYTMMRDVAADPQSCIKCRKCEEHCPQHIEITEILTAAIDTFEAVRNEYKGKKAE